MLKRLFGILLTCSIILSGCTSSTNATPKSEPSPSTSSSSPEISSSSVVRDNVDTSPISSEASSSSLSEAEEAANLLIYYLSEVEKATALEEYLRKELSPNDHGGISIFKSDIVTLNIWVVNPQKVNDILSAYNGDKFEPTLNPANCSYQAMSDLCQELENISINSDEKLFPSLSEEFNSVTVNIASSNIKVLTDKVQTVLDKAIKNDGFPSECVNIYVMSENRENPVT